MSTPSAPQPSSPVSVAVDVGPLHGHRTGVAVVVDATVDALARRSDVSLRPYFTSFRTRPATGERRLPLPALAGHLLWSRTDHPRVDRWLGAVDVVHGLNYVVPPTRAASVVTVHDCWFLRHPTETSAASLRMAAVLRRAVRRGAWVHAVSEHTAREVRELLDTDRVYVAHSGLPARVDAGALPASVERPFLLSIGTEERRKDVPLAIRAFARLATTSPDLRFVVAGAAGDDSTRIDETIGDLAPEVRDRVVRLGVVSAGEKWALLAAAAVVVYPSLDEGFGFPVLEAQLAGTPVVATDVGAIAEIGGDGVSLVADRDPDALATAVDRVLHGTGVRLGLITAGFENTGRFSWDTAAAVHVDRYRTIREVS